MTDADIKKLIGVMKPVFATKEDLSVFATKDDLGDFPTAAMVQRGFEAMDKRFDAVDARLDHIENLLLADDHERRIERLEQDVKDLKSALAM